MQTPDPPQAAPSSRRQRLAWLVLCILAGLLVGFVGSWVSGNSAWYLAVTAVVALGWWFLADPSQCDPASRRQVKNTQRRGP